MNVFDSIRNYTQNLKIYKPKILINLSYNCSPIDFDLSKDILSDIFITGYNTTKQYFKNNPIQEEEDIQEEDIQEEDIQEEDIQEEDIQEEDIQEEDIQEEDIQEEDIQEEDIYIKKNIYLIIYCSVSSTSSDLSSCLPREIFFLLRRWTQSH